MNQSRHAKTPATTLKSRMQRAAVRVVASELDRRSAALERELRAVNARLSGADAAHTALQTRVDATDDYVRRVHDHLLDLEVAHGRLTAMHTALAARLDGTEAGHTATRRDLEVVAGEFTALREAFARLDRLIEGRPDTPDAPDTPDTP